MQAVKLPFTVGGTDGAKDLFSFFDDTLANVEGALAVGMPAVHVRSLDDIANAIERL